MLRRSKRIVFGGLLAFMLGVTISSGSASAIYYGTGSGSGGKPGCPTPFSTCYGATWKWYDWDTAINGGYTGMWNDGNGRIYIDGSVSGTRDFIAGTARTKEVISNACADSKYKGFWRYAMVANTTMGYGSEEGGLRVAEGNQYGLIGIAGNGDSVFDSQYNGGSMGYIEDGGNTWEDVNGIYNVLKSRYPDEFPLDWNLGGKTDNLAWFCSPADVTASYASSSNVSNSKAGGYSSTGINSGALKTSWATTAYAAVNDSVTVTFSHNAYATTASKNVKWEIGRTNLSSTSSYTVSVSEQKTSPNPADLTVPEDNYFAAENRGGSDGSNSFIQRDVYEITYKREGTYTHCEKISVDGTYYTQVCTKVVVGAGVTGVCGAGGELGTYVTGTTSVVSKAINQRLGGTYSGWKPQTYARPGDLIAWKNCYLPGVQEHAFKSLVELDGRIVGTHGNETGCSCTSNSYKTFKDVTTWTNEFTVTTTSPFGFNDLDVSKRGPMTFPTNPPLKLSIGDSKIQSVDNNYSVASVGDVGKTFEDEIWTPGYPNHTTYTSTNHSWSWYCCSCACGTSTCCDDDGCWTCCPYCCTLTFSHCNAYTIGTHQDGERREKSQISIPYNFINTTSVGLNTTTVYSGEAVGVINPMVNVGTRQNDAVEDNYATQVDNAQVKLIAYVSGSNQSGDAPRYVDGVGANLCGGNSECMVVKETGSTTLNETGDLGGRVYRDTVRGTTFSGSYNVYDTDAGKYFCVALAVYPATSKEDKNLEAKGDDKWYVSTPACAVVAKRPSFQVWGGDLYSEAGIRTSVSTKHNLFGFYGYTPFDRSNTTVFGSWVEESVVSNGIVTLLASGAGTAGGSKEGATATSGYCQNRTPLSFANFGVNKSIGITICGAGSSVATGSAGIASNVVNRASLVSYWVPEEIKTGEVSGPISLSDGYLTPTASATGRNIRYGYSSGGLTISGGALGLNTTYVVRAGGTVTINGNITYPLSDAMSSTGAIPKAVIYAGGDINISCSVGEVDAVLIAEGVVNTCYDAGDVNAPNRSLAQLTIRGAVIANSLELPRTYGAAKGSASGVAAEVIDYDTSAILWGRYMAGAAESDTLTVTYQHELAPRY